MSNANKLLIHYYLTDNSHSMDAIVRNKCEAEALHLVKEIARIFNLSITIETEAYEEGGLKEIWKFIGDNGTQLSFIFSIIVLIFSRVPVSDEEQDKPNKELTKLSIQEKTLIVEKLKKELNKNPENKDSINKVVEILNSDSKIATRKSNFYKNLIGYEKVTAVGIAPTDLENNPTQDEEIIKHTDFRKHILRSDELPVLAIENATIEIISPVLKNGGYQWKGIYDGVPISFSMGDRDFKKSVMNKSISFQHGSHIECLLHISRKLDEVGEIKITGYSVKLVFKKFDGASSFETPQGKEHNLKKSFTKNQIILFE